MNDPRGVSPTVGHAEFSYHMNKLVTDNGFKNVCIFKFSIKPSTSWFSVGIRYGSHRKLKWRYYIQKPFKAHSDREVPFLLFYDLKF